MLDQPILFLATTNAKRAREFYERRLGLDFVADDPYALVLRTGSSLLRIQKVASHLAASHTVLGWEVPEIRARIRELEEAGVRFERYDHLEQDEYAVWTAPGGTRVAWFQDPDGNLLSLTQGAGR